MPLTGSEAHSIIAGGLLHGDQVTAMAQMEGSAADVGTWRVARITSWKMRVIADDCRVGVVGGGWWWSGCANYAEGGWWG